MAILISPPYLAVQIRHSTQELSRSAEASQLAAFEKNIKSGNRVRELLLLNLDLIDLMTKGYGRQNPLWLDEILQNPGVREWRAGKKPDWRPAFKKLVDERLAVFQQSE